MTKQETIAEFIGFDILSNGYYQYEGEITQSLPDFEADWNWLIKVVRLCKEKQFFDTQHLIDNIDEALMQCDSKDLAEECLEFITEWNKGYES